MDLTPLDNLITLVRELYWSGDYDLNAFMTPLNIETRSRPTLSKLVRGQRFQMYGGPIMPIDPFINHREPEDSIELVIDLLRDSFPRLSIEQLAKRFKMSPLHVRKTLSGEIGKYRGNLHKELLDRPNYPGKLLVVKELYQEHKTEFRKEAFGDRKRKPKH